MTKSGVLLPTLFSLLTLVQCTLSKPVEISELEYIINRDFPDVATVIELKSIYFQDKLSYNSFDDKTLRKDNTLIPEIPVSQHPTISEVVLGRAFFTPLILNQQITEKEFAQIKQKVASISHQKIEKRNGIESPNSTSSIDNKFKLNEYQEFAYPIMTDNLLIIYRDVYSGLKHPNSLGSTGNGTYFIYRKTDKEWKLINKIVKWIT